MKTSQDSSRTSVVGWVTRSMLLGVVFLAGCSFGSSSSPLDALDAVPREAVAVVSIDWERASHNPVLRSFTDAAQISAAFQELSVPLTGLRRAVLFSTSVGLDPKRAVLTTGPALGKQWRTAAHGDAWTSQSGVHTAVVSADIVALGSSEPVGLAARPSGTSGGFTSRPEFLPLAHFFGAGDAVAASVIWPQELRDHAATAAVAAGFLARLGIGSAGGVLGQLGLGRAFAVRLDGADGSIKLTTGVLFEEEATAQAIAGGLSAVQGLAGFVSGLAPQQTQPTPMGVTRDGALVTVALTMPASAWSR